MKVCPNCSAEFDDQLNFCRQDGTALQLKQAGKTCPSCGEDIWNNSKFCRHCGASVDQPKPSSGGEISESLVLTSSDTKGPGIGTVSVSGNKLAEDQLKQAKYRDAIATLDGIIKANPENQEARLLYLYATVKLYNVYGYEKQIEDLRLLSDLSEKEREIVKEVFLIRAQEAQKRGKTDEYRDYQRLATRVILGQPLIEAQQQPALLPTEARTLQAPGPTSSPNLEQKPHQSPRPTRKADAPSYARNYSGRKERKSRLVVSFVLVFGLAGVLGVGMLAHYAKKQGVDITDLLKSRPPKAQQREGVAETSNASPVGQVLAAEELGFRVWGSGAVDPNRKESFISERIGSQLSDLRQLYQLQVQEKPELMGSIILQLTIAPAGEVTKVEEYAARIQDDDFRKLLITEAYKWRFPEATSGLTKVNYPILFVPPRMDIATVLQWERSAGPARPGAAEPKEATYTASAPRAPVEKPTKIVAKGRERAAVPTVPSPPIPPMEKLIIGQYEALYPTTVYSEPREDSTTVARIEAGTKLNIVDVRGEWLEVRSRQGRPPGFVKKDAATPLSSR